MVPYNIKNLVNQVTPNPRNSVTTVDLHLEHSRRSGHRLDILKAQIAYTLNVQSFHTGSIQLSFDGGAPGRLLTPLPAAQGLRP